MTETHADDTSAGGRLIDKYRYDREELVKQNESDWEATELGFEC